MPRTLGNRICVYGPSGSGKTTLGRELGDRLSLPFIELDAIIHCKPDWEDLSIPEFQAAVNTLLEEHDGWVFDGNYSPVRKLILPHATDVVWLRLPWLVVYPRLFRRTMSRMFTRELLWGVNRESFRMSFFSRESILWWGIHHWRPGMRKTAEDLLTIPHDARVVVLRRSSEVEAFLAGVPKRPAR